MSSVTISVNEASFQYHKTGNGFPLVFIHGFCEDHTIWQPFVLPFAEKYTLLLPDLPGFGQSSLPNRPCSIDYYADCIKAMLDAEHITSCALIGHSMGGYIALNFAKRYSRYLAAFGLFHSTAAADDASKKMDRQRVADFVRTHGAAPFVNQLYQNLFAEKFKAENQQSFNALKKHASETSTVEGVAQASLAMRDRPDTIAVLEETTVPVLFIIGSEDKAVSPQIALQQSHLPERSVISLAAQTGHMGMFEAPEKCSAAILEWLLLFA